MARFAVRYDSIAAFLSDLSLHGVYVAEAEDADVVDGKVILSTVHQAKGLEWDVVFLIGMNDRKFPSSKSLKSSDEEEERRLFLCGCNTGEEGTVPLLSSYTREQACHGFFRPSRLARELPADCFEEILVEDV